MIETIALASGATLFVILQAGYWARHASRARLDTLLRARLGSGQKWAPVVLQKKRSRLTKVSDLLEQAALGWTGAGLAVRAAGLATVGALLGVAIEGVRLGFVFILLAFVGLYLFLARARTLRLEKVNAQLPRALEIMVLALRAGQSLPRAVTLTAEELPAPMRGELQRVAEEQALGRPLEEAFIAMSERLPGSEAVRTLTTGILILRQTGGNLIELIERLLESMTAQTAFRMRLRAVTSEGRSSGTMLVSLPLVFAALAAVSDASYMRLFLEDATGHVLMSFAIGFWLSGAAWIQRLLSET